MFRMVGKTYGGKMLDLDLVPKGSIVISAGLGEEISFDLELLAHGCAIVGLDPTEKAMKFVEGQNLENFMFLPAALSHEPGPVTMYKNPNPKHVSESILPNHRSVSKESYMVGAYTIPELLEMHPNTSVIKMDVEGAEYEIIKSLTSLKVPQVVIEFHHFCSDYTLKDTHDMIARMKTLGYPYYVPKKSSEPLAEMTFVHESCL